MKNNMNRKGFTFPELLMATAIIATVFVQTMLGIIYFIRISESSRNSSTAVLASRNKMIEIENTTFANIINQFNNVSFTTSELTGSGVSYVTSLSSDLLEVTVTFCWQEINGRVYGEDADIDGVIDAGEDINNNNMLDSPVQIKTFIYDT